MAKKITSVAIDETLELELKNHDLSFSDLVNTLLSAWVKSVKQKGNVIDSAIEKTLIIAELRELVDRIERYILDSGEAKDEGSIIRKD